MSRLEAIKTLVEQAPDDSRVRFMLCMEYMNASRLEEALAEMDRLLERDPDYVAAYYHAGRASEQSGDEEAARGYYLRGIEAAQRRGDNHALSELQAALDILGG